MCKNDTYFELSRDKNKHLEKLSLFNFSTKLLSTLIWMIFPVVILILVPVLKKNANTSEWWTQTFSRAYANVASIFSKWLPISLTEILFICLAIFIIIALVSCIKLLIKKKWISGISKALSICAVVVSIIATYDLSCEFAYNRKKLNLPYYSTQVDNSEFKDIYNYFAEDLNYCISQLSFDENGDVKRPMNIYGLSRAVNQSYSILDNNDYFYHTMTYAKPMMSSFIYRELQITGLTFNPLGEANVNVLATSIELPITVAHELAHTKGVMREDDANQTAFYVCLNSDNPYLRFSAYSLYFYQLTIITSKTYMFEEDRKQLTPIEDAYYKARNYAHAYWKKHDLLGKIGDWFNNLYIKSSGVEEGTSSYQGGTDSTPVPDETDPTVNRLVSSKYQQLFFEKYYRVKGENHE